MLIPELKKLRKQHSGVTLQNCADALGITIQGYLRKEKGEVPTTGIELAKLARLYEMPLRKAFPSYNPTDGEMLLAKELGRAA